MIIARHVIKQSAFQPGLHPHRLALLPVSNSGRGRRSVRQGWQGRNEEEGVELLKAGLRFMCRGEPRNFQQLTVSCDEGCL